MGTFAHSTTTRHTPRSNRALKLGVRPFCRECRMRVGRLSSRCICCQTAYPGLRPRLSWQVIVMAGIGALLGCGVGTL